MDDTWIEWSLRCLELLLKNKAINLIVTRQTSRGCWPYGCLFLLTAIWVRMTNLMKSQEWLTWSFKQIVFEFIYCIIIYLFSYWLIDNPINLVNRFQGFLKVFLVRHEVWNFKFYLIDLCFDHMLVEMIHLIFTFNDTFTNKFQGIKCICQVINDFHCLLSDWVIFIDILNPYIQPNQRIVKSLLTKIYCRFEVSGNVFECIVKVLTKLFRDFSQSSSLR